MPIVDTEMGLRRQLESARRERFEPVAPFTSTNVQTAIQEAYALSTIFAITPTIVTTAQSPYTPTAADRILLVNSTAGPVTINMQPQAARNGLDLVVKDDKGQSVTNNISVVRNGAETIDGLTTYLIDSNYGSATFSPQTGGYYVKD